MNTSGTFYAQIREENVQPKGIINILEKKNLTADLIRTVK